MNKNLILKVSKIIDASRENLFEYWIQPQHLPKWWGPKDVICTEVSIDLKPGGKYKLVNKLETGDIIEIYREYLAIEPPKLLKFTWSVTGISKNEIVTVRFEEKTGKTKVIVLHEGITNNEIKHSHDTGWSGCFDELTIYAKS